MTDKKPIIIDLCKIGFGFWIIISAVFVFCLISEASARITLHSETIDTFRYEDVNGTAVKFTVEESEDCWQGVTDVMKNCHSIVYGGYAWENPPDFSLFTEIFAFVNTLNLYLWFVVLNRKYGKYEFRFKKCNGDYV